MNLSIEDLFFNISDYTLNSRPIGDGCFGTVYVATNIKNNEKYALKIIKTEGGFNSTQQMHFMRESLILHKLNHPSIV